MDDVYGGKVSKKVKIICDASFDSDLMLTTFSGSVSYNASNGVSLTQNYSGSSGTLPDSGAGEIQAALVGLMNLKAIMHKECINPESVKIYSDSLTLVDGYKSHKARPSSSNLKYVDQFRTISKLLAELNITNLHLSHVRSHVPDHLATALEKEHNKHDVLAMNSRIKITNTIFSPFHEGSKWYAVLLDSLPHSSTSFNQASEGAVSLARRGFKARIKFNQNCDHISNHPFIQALNNYAAEAKVNVDTLYDLDNSSTKPDFGNCILKHHQVLNSVEGELSSRSLLSFRSAIDAIFGFADFGCHYEHGKANPIAFCVFDLTREINDTPVNYFPESVSEWLDLIVEYIQIEHRFGVNSLAEFSKYGHLKYVSGKRINRINKLVYDQLRRYGEGADIKVAAKNIQTILCPNIQDTHSIVKFITFSIQNYRARIGSNYTLASHIARTVNTKINILERRKKSLTKRSHYQDKLQEIADSNRIDTSNLSKLDLQLTNELLKSGPSLPKDEVVNKLIDILINHGYPSTEPFKTGVARSVTLLDIQHWKNPVKLVPQCIKVADKFRKALQSKPIPFLNR